MPDVVQLESQIGSAYAEGTEDVGIFADSFERIVAAALSEDDTVVLISRMEREQRK